MEQPPPQPGSSGPNPNQPFYQGQPPYQGQPQPLYQPGQPLYQGQPPYQPGQPPYQGQPPLPARNSRMGCVALALVGGIVGFIAIATIVVLVLAGPTVGSVFSAVSKGLGGVSTVEMARGFQQSPAKALNVTSTFKPTDQPLHCVVTLLAPPANTKVKTIWYTIEAGGSKDENLKELEIVTGGKENVIDFTLNLNENWPIGTYKVEVYVNDVYSQSINFSVQ